MLTQLALKKVICYDPDTGIFTWRVTRPGAIAGRVAGCERTGTGYIRIRVDYKLYQAHRLAVLYMEGVWPEHEVDHINGIKTDNAWDNIRKCTQSENLKNLKMNSRNKSGYKGVSWNKRMNKWQVQAVLNRETFYLGHYSDVHEAGRVYDRFARKHHGEFYNNTQVAKNLGLDLNMAKASN